MRILLIGNYPHDNQESMQRFARLMFDGLQASGQKHVDLIFPKPFFGKLNPSSTGFGKWLGYLDKFIVFPLTLKATLAGLYSKDSDRDLVIHICDHSNAFYSRHVASLPHLVTCHDLLAIRSALDEIPENKTRWFGRRLQAMILNGLRRARHIACVSEATKSDLLRIANIPSDRVSVIYNALNYPYSPMPANEAVKRVRRLLAELKGRDLSHGKGYILHVGGNQWYKNRLGVLRIYAKLREMKTDAPPLFMVGKSFTLEMLEYVEKVDLSPHVVSLSSCTSEDLCALYSSASMLVFPSLAEGFGWPVIEAQACGCPVICSDIKPFVEIAGSTVVMCAAEDERRFAQEIQRLLDNGDISSSLVESGLKNVSRFTRQVMIDQYVNLYRILLSKRDSGLMR